MQAAIRFARLFIIPATVALALNGCGGGTSATGGTGGTNITGGTGGTGGTPMLSLLAGNTNGPGHSNGTGSAASFASPTSVATDSAGNVYVADSYNQTIRKITTAGVVTILAGTPGVRGSADGTGAAARFFFPYGVATDSAGNVYVADYGNNTIRKITPAGVVTTLAGTAGVMGSANGTGAAASFNYPTGVATDSASNVYVADMANSIIRKITPTGVVTTLAGSAGVVGSADGTGAAASFGYAHGVATDSTGNVYVVDSLNNTIRKITSAGVVTTLAGTAGVVGSADGTGAAASFNQPGGVAVDNAGNVYVADMGNNVIRKITPAGVVTTLAGTASPFYGYADGIGAAARFAYPYGVVADSAGNVYVADTSNSVIRKVTPAGVVTTLAGSIVQPGSADGTGAAAGFNIPAGLATDSAGNVYVADSYNSSVRKVTPAGVVTTLANSTSLFRPSGVAIDSTGNVYVANTSQNTIRKITPAGVVTTLAGSGVVGSADGTGTAASFNTPTGVATDNAGNVYVTDGGNHTIRKITPAGVVTTLAGTAGVFGSADGTGAAARFLAPDGVATDSAGNLYVADTGNNTIRKITPAGVVSTLAGTAGVAGSADGTGTAASFYIPVAVTTDSTGNVYVTDTNNHTIRKITATGVVTTIVGQPGLIGFVSGNSPGSLAYPRGVAINGNTMYIASQSAIVQVTTGSATPVASGLVEMTKMAIPMLPPGKAPPAP